ncbi:MAG: 2-hydroxyacid dehydrogenase [Rubrivivax sp.]|nr:2-hydroxyacid dehydrogenase [Rubrivivax sp.]
MSEPIHVLAVSRLSPLWTPQLHAAYAVHDRLHETDPAAFERIAPQIRAIAASGESRVSAELIARLPALELISVMGVGYDGVDVAAAKARGVTVTHTPNVLNDDVADLAIGLALCAARQLPQADRWVRSGDWAAKGPMPLARKLSGGRLGLVGMGRIGQAIATRAQAFGMAIAYTSRSAKAVPYRYLPDAKALAAESDVLVVITPGGAATRKLIDADVLAALGKGRGEGILVNVARGSVVDEAALIDALERGVIAGAGLDVFENEPNVPERLRAIAQVVLAPHIGSATGATRQAMADLAHGNLQAHFAGQPLLTPTPEYQGG